MEKYRLKKSPAVMVHAELLTEDNVDRLANIAQAQVIEEGTGGIKVEALNIKTPNGKERLHQGMYLIKVGSDFYTAQAVNFEQRYEQVITLEEAQLTMPTDDPWEDIPRIKEVP